MYRGQKALYRLEGWEKRTDILLSSCLFSIYLDSEFAKKCLAFNLGYESQQRFIENARLIVEDSDARIAFFGESLLPCSLAVSGNCCCTGIVGTDHNPEHWGKMVEYGGHNIDSRQQAYDLLSLFISWLETAEALLPNEIICEHTPDFIEGGFYEKYKCSKCGNTLYENYPS